MKTKNNTQKTALKSTALAIGLVILSFTVNAQEVMRHLFENKETSNIAMLTGKMSHNSFASTTDTRSLATDAFASFLVNETEEPLQLEDWMTNESNFTTMFQIETESENPQEIEDWMTKESNFDANMFSLVVETEEELKLEDWMLNEDNFSNNQKEIKITKTESKPISTATFYYREVNNEEKLVVEDWMINPKIWKK